MIIVLIATNLVLIIACAYIINKNKKHSRIAPVKGTDYEILKSVFDELGINYDCQDGADKNIKYILSKEFFTFKGEAITDDD